MIYPTEIGIIVKLIRKPNAIIVLPFIQSISKILTTLPSSRISSENFACLRHIYRICTVVFLQILFKRPDDFNRAMFLFCACFCICPVYFKSVIGLFPLRITVDYFEINLSSLMLKKNSCLLPVSCKQRLCRLHIACISHMKTASAGYEKFTIFNSPVRFCITILFNLLLG